MKLLLIGLLTITSFSSFAAGSLDCTFTKNSQIIPLFLELGDDYDEEKTELYYAVDGDVNATVIYLPYQYGIVLAIENSTNISEDEGETQASTTFENHEDLYTLSCIKK